MTVNGNRRIAEAVIVAVLLALGGWVVKINADVAVAKDRYEQVQRDIATIQSDIRDILKILRTP